MKRYLGPCAAIALAGCGGGSSHTSPPPTAAQAQSIAARVNLQPADLPGFAASPPTRTAASRRQELASAACEGLTDPGLRLADQSSQEFSRTPSPTENLLVSSIVVVLPSASQVAHDITALTSARGRACVARNVTSEIRSSNPTIHFGTITSTPIATPSGAFDYRIMIPAQVAGLTIRFYVDALGFASGRLEVALLLLRTGQPYDAAETKRLYGLLTARANASQSTGAATPRPAY
jgi:hypothetical protein